MTTSASDEKAGDESRNAEEPGAPAADRAPEVPFEGSHFRQRKSRPLLGGAFWTFGALFWAYLVMGELVVHFDVNEAAAMLVVLAALGLAWYGAARHAPDGKLALQIAPGVGGIVLFFVVLSIGAVAFETSRLKTVEALTVAFWFPALFAYVGGRSLMRAPKPVLTRRQRAGGIALWVTSSLATALSLLSAISRM